MQLFRCHKQAWQNLIAFKHPDTLKAAKANLAIPVLTLTDSVNIQQAEASSQYSSWWLVVTETCLPYTVFSLCLFRLVQDSKVSKRLPVAPQQMAKPLQCKYPAVSASCLPSTAIFSDVFTFHFTLVAMMNVFCNARHNDLTGNSTTA